MTTNRKRPTASRMVMYLMTSYVSLKSQGHDLNSQYTETVLAIPANTNTILQY